MKKIHPFIIILVLTAHSVSAQKSRKIVKVFLPNWSISAKAGISQFQGDLQDQPSKNEQGSFLKPNGMHMGIAIRRQLGLFGGISFQTAWANIKGQEHKYYNAEFRSSLWQFQLQGSIDFIHLVYPDIPYGRQRIFLEPSVGIGFTAFNSKAYELGGVNQLRSTDGFQWRRSYSFGVEGRYFITENHAIGIEFSTTYLNTDVLDATMGGAPLATGIVQDPSDKKFETAKDHWGFISISVTQLIRTRNYRNPRQMQ